MACPTTEIQKDFFSPVGVYKKEAASGSGSRFKSWNAWIQIPAPLLQSCVTLGNLHNFSVPSCLYLQNVSNCQIYPVGL